jgi:hypothetical protein
LRAGEYFKDLYSAVLTRIGLGFIAILITVANVPFADHLIFDLGKAIIVAVAIGAWVSAEIMSYKSAPHQHDVDLRNSLRTLVVNKLGFLRDHHFGGPFNTSSVAWIDKISETWIGVTYQFQDRAIQKQWAAIREKIEHLYHHIGINAHYFRDSTVMKSFNRKLNEENDFSEETRLNMDRANLLATEIYVGFEGLEALCLRRLGGATLGITGTQGNNGDTE